MVLPLIIGGISAIGGIASAVGQQQSANAQVDYANRSRLRSYNDQLRIQEYNWRNTLQHWNAKVNDYDANVRNINAGLDQAYLNTQLQMNEVFKQAAFKGQEALINQVQSQGKLSARLQSGRSSARAKALDRAAYGRNQAILAASLQSKKMAARQQDRQYQLQAQSKLNAAYSQVAVAPTPPLLPDAPEMMARPSNIGMIGGIASSVAGLANTFASYDFGGGGSGMSNRAQLGIGGNAYGMAADFGNKGYTFPTSLNTAGWFKY